MPKAWIAYLDKGNSYRGAVEEVLPDFSVTENFDETLDSAKVRIRKGGSGEVNGPDPGTLEPYTPVILRIKEGDGVMTRLINVDQSGSGSSPSADNLKAKFLGKWGDIELGGSDPFKYDFDGRYSFRARLGFPAQYPQGYDSYEYQERYKYWFDGTVAKSGGKWQFKASEAIGYHMPRLGDDRYMGFLVDSVAAERIGYHNVGYDRSWGVTYTLSLMSETKLLEKVQLPNLSITHSLTSGRLSVYDWIARLMHRYSPCVKKAVGAGAWEHGRAIEIDPAADWGKFKSAECADLSMSKPTLRQALTSLFAQVGCIPKVEFGKLSYLDFSFPERCQLYGVKNMVNDLSGYWGSVETSFSAASDSWANTLVAEAPQTVDAEGRTSIEQLCFRDRDRAVLKQRENLFLETRFPIYEVTKLRMGAYVESIPSANVAHNAWEGYMSPGAHGGGMAMSWTQEGGWAVFSMKPFVKSVSTTTTVDGKVSIVLSLLKTNASGGLDPIETTAGTAIEYDVKWEGVPYGSEGANEIKIKGWELSKLGEGTLAVASATFSGKVQSGTDWEELDRKASLSVYDNGTGFFSKYSGSEPIGYWYVRKAESMAYLAEEDITPLCVESSKRSQLEVDFLSMPDWAGAAEMAKWLYATVGYSIGGRRIEGFSSTYAKSNGWWDETKTYVENLISAIRFEYGPLMRLYGGAFAGCDPAQIFDRPRIYNPFFDGEANAFALLFFDVEYVPLADVKLPFSKPFNEANLPIEQLDSASSGVSSMDSLSLVESDKALRIGNMLTSAHQRAEHSLQCGTLGAPLSLGNGSGICHSRTIRYGLNCVDAEYSVMKNAVAEHYFSSIVTKYRAFEYVDYSQSIERRELGSAFVLWSESGYLPYTEAGDPRLKVSFSDESIGIWAFFDALSGKADGSRAIVNSGFLDSVEGDPDVGEGSFTLTKNDVQTTCSGDGFSLTFAEYDNASDGPYVDGKYIDSSGAYKSNPIGGLPQRWYGARKMNGDCEVRFYSRLKPLVPPDVIATSGAESQVRKIQRSPHYYRGGVSEPDASDFSYGLSCFVPLGGKDASERLAYTLAVSLSYRTTVDLRPRPLATKWLWRYSSAFGGLPEGARLAICMPGARWRNGEPYRESYPGEYIKKELPSGAASLEEAQLGGRCVKIRFSNELNDFKKDTRYHYPMTIAAVRADGTIVDLMGFGYQGKQYPNAGLYGDFAYLSLTQQNGDRAWISGGGSYAPGFAKASKYGLEPKTD